MKTISVNYFDTHFHSLIKDIAQSQESFLITQDGKPIARILPITGENISEENPLKNSIVFEKDIISPAWNIS